MTCKKASGSLLWNVQSTPYSHCYKMCCKCRQASDFHYNQWANLIGQGLKRGLVSEWVKGELPRWCKCCGGIFTDQLTSLLVVWNYLHSENNNKMYFLFCLKTINTIKTPPHLSRVKLIFYFYYSSFHLLFFNSFYSTLLFTEHVMYSMALYKAPLTQQPSDVFFLSHHEGQK